MGADSVLLVRLSKVISQRHKRTLGNLKECILVTSIARSPSICSISCLFQFFIFILDKLDKEKII